MTLSVVRPDGSSLREVAARLNQVVQELNYQWNVVTKTTTYTSVHTDGLVLCDTSGGAFTVTLPDARAALNRPYRYKLIGANPVTLDGYSTQTIDGAATKVISSLYDCVVIISDGSNWHIV